MRKASVFALLSLLIALTVLVAPVKANLRERVGTLKEKVQEETQEKRKEFVGKKCDQLEQRIATKITNFDNTHQFHVRQYGLMKEKIEKVIATKEAEGKDVSKLKTDLQTFNDKVALFATHRQEFIDALKRTQEHACGESEGAFKAALKTAQEKHKVVIADAKDIRSFYMNTLRPDLKALRD